jgi:hypothetical protein
MADKSALGAINRPLQAVWVRPEAPMYRPANDVIHFFIRIIGPYGCPEYFVNQHIMTKLHTIIDGLNTNFSLRCLFSLNEETCR